MSCSPSSARWSAPCWPRRRRAPGPSLLVRKWLARDDSTLKYTLGMFSDMRNLRVMDFATLSVAVRRLAQLATAHTRIA